MKDFRPFFYPKKAIKFNNQTHHICILNQYRQNPKTEIC